MKIAMARITLINPRFEASYWGFEYALPLMRRRANLPTACLPLLAALTPEGHQVTLVDENVEDLDFDRLTDSDIVGLTGMSVQRKRMREILTELKRRGVFTIVGGPWVTVREEYFGDLADVIFVGEAEQTWPQFLDDFRTGTFAHRYEQLEKTDMTRVPVPRYDLLKMNRYAFGSLQISRGCPFQCEFCDIIVTFGRKPRLKNSTQVIAEIDALQAAGMQTAFIVDDNLIGNKQAVKPVLREIALWQQRHGFPINFFTEASLDLADDAELMQLMVDANVSAVFVGIESPNEASLRETKKFQNVRAGGTIAEKVRRVQGSGLEVWCGMILGFDHDDATVFDAHYKFLHEARIMQAMVGMLAAIPKTPLHARLAAEGRLGDDDDTEFGTNVIPALMTRGELRDGYIALLERLHEPASFFGRLDDLFLDPQFQLNKTRTAYFRKHRWAWLKNGAVRMAQATGIFIQLMRMVPEPALRREYRRRLWNLLKHRCDPELAFIYAIKCAVHYHVHKMTEQMKTRTGQVVNSF